MSAAPLPPTGPPRFLGLVFGFVFAAVGITIIISLWSAEGFHAPPLVFKLVGSLIAFAVMAVGGTLFFSSLKGQETRSSGGPSEPPSGTGYTCPSCSARLGANADVSPKGDVKCGYCQRWFNIHG
ncbi:MAG TPA: hypothetical protein VF614_03465 [Chthoniobacteraceae bacterium]|jgi:hypothetical protein